jgi:hypothetical protein
MNVSKEVIGSKIVDRDRDHQTTNVLRPAPPLRPFESLRVAPSDVEGRQAQGDPERGRGVSVRGGTARVEGQDVVGQERFLDITARCEKLAGRRESLGDLGDDSRWA